jgi:hypothetical protein
MASLINGPVLPHGRVTSEWRRKTWVASMGLVEDTPENHPRADAAFWSNGVRKG